MSDRRGLLWLLGLLLVCVLVDAPALRGDFIWDDTSLVLKNQYTDSLSNLPSFFQIDLWSTVEAGHGGGHTPYYRPMMLVSLLVDRTLYGLSPLGAHLHSLLWHLLVVGLVWRLLLGMVEDARAATAGAAIFALHPFHLELVSFVAARNDTMAAAGLLGALLLLEPAKVGPGRLVGAGLCALFALLSKESAALVVGLLLVMDVARHGRPTGPGRYGVLLAAVGVWVGLRSQVALTSAGEVGLDALAGVPAALAHYAGELLAPLPYEPAVYLVGDTPTWGWLALALVLAGVAARAGGRVGLAGLGVAGLTFAPALLGVHFSGVYSHRYAYLPMVGVALIVAALMVAAVRSRRALGVALAVAGVLGVISARSVGVWASTTQFWEHNYAMNSNPMTACPLFVDYALAGEDDAAEPMLRAALEGPVLDHCCLWASRFYFERGRPELARTWGRQALVQGCALTPELAAPLAMSEALACQWDEAEALVTPLSGDPYGYRPLVLSAAALRRGDESVLEAYAADRGGAVGAGGLRERAEYLISQSSCDSLD